MIKHKFTFILPLLAVLLLASCGTSRRAGSEAAQREKLSNQLGVRVTQKDNLKLYTEVVSWLGTPYRGGGQTRRGTDCSGFTSQVYKTVYKQSLQRTTSGQLSQCKKVGKGSLKEGDLVFFSTARGRKRSPTHVGIYLKSGCFIHASSSKGVIVSKLSEPYYVRNWMTGGRVR